jgi:hypothetical protein
MLEAAEEVVVEEAAVFFCITPSPVAQALLPFQAAAVEVAEAVALAPQEETAVEVELTSLSVPAATTTAVLLAARAVPEVAAFP